MTSILPSRRPSLRLFASTTPPQDDVDDEECADEEGCEIDWDNMPGGDDDIPEETASSMRLGLERQWQNNNKEDEEEEECADGEACEIDWDAMPGNPSEGSVSSNARLGLEMQWQLSDAVEDCDVDLPQSCGSEPCLDCRGKGWTVCRFCRGTNVLYLPATSARPFKDFVSCSICQKGTERCRSCKGTGWIAGWTQLQGSEQ
jgi:hypothetical protein